MHRREVLGMGLGLGVAAVGWSGSSRAQAAGGRYGEAFERLDRYVNQFMTEMNAPGMTLVLADETGVQRVMDYGFEDLERQLPLRTGRLFHIGSISKSFLGLCLVQLVEEGKLDMRRPVRDYLPWLRFDDNGRAITAHDLITHGAALPDGALFPADPALRYRATAAPGTLFHYCNMGYEALGLLLAQLDGGSLADSFRRRLLIPLGMMQTEPVIVPGIAAKVATAYMARQTDRPLPRFGELTRAPALGFTSAAGCIASPARDMGAYLTMLIRRGEGPQGRVVSPAGFADFMARHQPAEHFGPGAAYGYGIANDQLDGHTRLRHTGGMVSFASALEVDLDARCGVFASINAMQGYRPRPVAEYALRLMRACREGKPLPPIPEPAPSWRVEQPARYAGRYTSADGRVLEVVASGNRLELLHRGQRVTLEPTLGAPDSFHVLHEDFALFPLLFGRAAGGAGGAGNAEAPVVTASWGADCHFSAAYAGPKTFATPAGWAAYAGEYRNEDPWIGSRRIVVRQGRLWMDGVVPLEPAADGKFFLRDEPDSPEWVSFRETADGKAVALYLSGLYLTRV
jgi:CubicO group peptidase (beta-lactamase class C family)